MGIAMDAGVGNGRVVAQTLGASGYLTIDLSALARNYLKLAKMLAPAKSAAVVKADAYGLGAARASRTIYEAGCRDFFVAQFREAVSLRSSLPDDAFVYVLNGLQPGNEVECAAAGIIPVINSLEQLQLWQSLAQTQGRSLPGVLQFDTGMSRLGLAPSECDHIEANPNSYSAIDIRFIMSHLASADEPESEQNGGQLAALETIRRKFPQLPICFANSGGVFLGVDYHASLARPGIALYGGNPIGQAVNPMEPVVGLKVAVVQVRTVSPGTRVGYGGAYVSTTEMRIATIAAGYADGLPRSLGDRGAVYFGDIRLPIVGRVSMDSMTVDVSALPDGMLSLGSLVEIIGTHQSIEDVAAAAGTIAYEILTGLGRRYDRRYI
jgi:alanine racemase